MSYFAAVIRRMFASFAIAISAMWAIYMLFDTVEHIRIIRAYQAPSGRLLDLALAHSPTALYQLAPLALLLSSAAVMLGISRSAELTALLAAGQSLKRRFMPFAVFSLVVAVATFTLGERLVPAAQSRYVELVDLEIKHKNTWGDKWRMDRQWFHGPSGFWRIGGRRANDSLLTDVTLYRMSDAFSLEKLLEMKNLAYLGKNRWQAEGLRQADETKMIQKQAQAGAEILNFPETPRHFEYVWRTADEMKLAELSDSAELRRSQGLSDRSYILSWHMRLAYVPLLFLLPVLAAVIIWNRSFLARRPGVWMGIGLTLGAGLLVFFTLLAFKSAGEAGFISPGIAAFMPVIIGVGACICLFRRIIS